MIKKTKKNVPQNYNTKDGILIGYQKKGTEKSIYIKNDDRLKHFYMIGQTGTGKSTMILNQAINDINKGNGICVIDVYGDLSEKILKYYPKERIDDLIYFDLSNTEFPIAFNPLDGAKNNYERDVITNNIVEMFVNIYGPEIFGPRIQDCFSNACLLLMEQPDGCTLLDIIRLFTDDAFAEPKIRSIKDPVVASRWNKIYKKMGDKEKDEIISFIQAKLSPFITSTYVRGVVGQPRSTFNFDEAMQGHKVVLCKFPKGIIGESNSTIMCKLILMQIKNSILKRTTIDENEREPFFVYMDDFNQYAPKNIGEFLHNATKYKVGVIMSNQYIEQINIDYDMAKIIFNNVGNVLTFRVGNLDAKYLEDQFSQKISKKDLENLEDFEGFIKTNQNGIQANPLFIDTRTKLNNTINTDDKIKIMKQITSLKRGTKRELVDKEIRFRMGV